MARHDLVQDPSRWEVRYRDRRAQVGWRDCIQQLRAKTLEAYNVIRVEPRRTSDDQYRLKGELGVGQHDGKALERWQYKISKGGRLWYLIDDDAKVLWIDYATLNHPKATQ